MPLFDCSYLLSRGSWPYQPRLDQWRGVTLDIWQESKKCVLLMSVHSCGINLHIYIYKQHPMCFPGIGKEV